MKVAILLPAKVDLAALCKARELAEVLLRVEPLCGDRVELAIGIPEGPEAVWRAREDYLLRGLQGQAVARKLRWESVRSANVGRMFMIHQLQASLHGIETVAVPRDWGWNFADCDVWFNLADPAQGAVLPLKPTAHYVSDLSVRIVPSAFASGIRDPYWDRQVEAFRMWRRSAVVLCGNPETKTDVVGYAGVRSDRIMVVPSLAQGATALADARPTGAGRQWLWFAEANARHAPVAVLKGLSLYRSEGGALRPALVSQDPARFVRLAGRDLMDDLPCFAVEDMRMLSRTIQRADGIWSSEVAGGEGWVLSLALRHGLPFLGQRFPLHERLAASAADSVRLYDSADPIAIADALHQMEAHPPRGSSNYAQPDFPELRHQQYGFAIDRLREYVRA